jgi:hypothetical protein
MDYLNYVIVQDASWNTDPYLHSDFLCGLIIKWNLNKNSSRHTLTFQLNDRTISWCCRDSIRESFSYKPCEKSRWRSCNELYLENVK